MLWAVVSLKGPERKRACSHAECARLALWATPYWCAPRAAVRPMSDHGCVPHRHGAEAGATNGFGESAVTLAESRGHGCVLDLLRGESAGSGGGGGSAGGVN